MGEKAGGRNLHGANSKQLPVVSPFFLFLSSFVVVKVRPIKVTMSGKKYIQNMWYIKKCYASIADLRV